MAKRTRHKAQPVKLGRTEIKSTSQSGNSRTETTPPKSKRYRNKPVSTEKSQTGARHPSSFLEEPIERPELIFGLVGAIGTDMDMVSRILSSELQKVRYESKHIKVTDTLKYFDHNFEVVSSPLEKKYATLMDAGNYLREKLVRNDAFALLSVAAIRHIRLGITKARDKAATGTAYILRQFKHPDEIEALRAIYGRAFIQISAYCTEQSRLDTLTQKIANSHHKEHRLESYKGKAFDLIARDHEEEGNDSGQKLRETFSLADVVIDAQDEGTARSSCARFIRAYFGDPFVTPTKDEYGAYAARAAAMRSADLARQVGAVTMTADGEVISIGCNEVPKAGGGTYWENDQNDARDFRRGYDSSVRGKQAVLEDAFRRLRAAGWLRVNYRQKDIPELVSEALWSGKDAIMKDSQLMDVLEFGRSVHAEMVAITDAARLGRPLKGATLYSTTFPCHLCARHIVSAGISRVVYIEPYTKSLAAELYPDSIAVDGVARMPGPKVKFDTFLGIAPPRYIEIFSRKKGARKSKKSGDAFEWTHANARPLLRWFVSAYIQVEAGSLVGLYARISEKDLKLKKDMKTHFSSD